MLKLYCGLMLLMSLVSFILMGMDKSKAKRGAWRISEKALFLASIFFGATGGTLGMFLFHHKTRHWYFKLCFPLLTVVQFAILLILMMKG